MAEEIIIKIDVQSGKAKAKLKDTQAEVEGLSRAEKERIKLQKELNYQLSEEARELASLKIAIRDQKVANDAYAQSQIGGTKAAKQFRTQAGLQNAILLETGRLASDVGFGFTAIANNISQLISLGTSFVNTTGSLKDSLKELGRSLIGSGGVILLIQLFIGALQDRRVQKFIGELFRLKGAFAELRDLTESYGQKIGELTGKFRLYTDILSDSNRSEEQKQIALKKLNEDYPEYNTNIETETGNLKEVNKEREKYIKLLQEQALSQAAQEKLLEIASEFGTAVLEKRIRLQEVQLEQTKQQNIIQSLLNKENITEAEKSNLQQAIRLKNLADSRIATLEEETKEVTKAYDERRGVITNFVNLTDKQDKKDKNRRARRFKQQFIDLTKIILDYNKRTSKINAINAQEQLDIDEQFAIKEANRRKDQFIERQAQRLEEYKEQVKGRKNADELIANAEEEYRESVSDAEDKHKQLLLSIENAYITERILLKEKEAQSVANIERKIENIELSRLQKTFLFNEEFYDKKRKQIEGDINLQEIALASTEMSLEDRKKAELELEKLKNNLFNLEVNRQEKLLSQNELLDSGLQGDMTYYDNRLSLLDEFITKQTELLDDQALSEEQRDQIRDRISQNQIARINTEKEAEIAAINARTSVNQEYINFAQGMSSLFSTIAGENEDLQNAALVVEKGAAIADIVVRTQAANAQIVAGHSAAAAIESATVPFTAAANIATQAKLGTAQVARNNVSAGISIANILATTLTSFKKPSAGASTASQTVQAPAFNVVGPSTTDQLLNTVGQNIGELEVNLSLNEVREGISTLNNLNVNSSITGV